nr:hypothetical protein [Bacillus cereus]
MASTLSGFCNMKAKCLSANAVE